MQSTLPHFFPGSHCLSGLFLLLLLTANGTGKAQEINGIVIDLVSQQPISHVSVENGHTSTTTGSNGRFRISGAVGDVLLFQHMSYMPIDHTIAAHEQQYVTIYMSLSPIDLKPVLITGLTKYQQDSIARYQQFEHELNKTLVAKPKFYGLACAGCIGWLADKITGNSKKPKEFREHYYNDNTTLFIDSRYTFEAVSTVTGLKDTDSVATFINLHPMEYAFARTATELELRMWIREQYRLYMHKKEE